MERQILNGVGAALGVHACLTDLPTKRRGLLTATGSTELLDPSATICLQVISGANFAGPSESKTETVLNPDNGNFSWNVVLAPRTAGRGELWVLMQQNGQTLVTLHLQPQIVAERASGTRLITTSASAVLAPPPARRNQLRIVQRVDGNSRNYLEYELTLGDQWTPYESLRLPDSLEEFVNAIYKNIESKWDTARGDIGLFSKLLQSHGSSLFTQLFPEALQDKLWTEWGRIESIEVLSTEPFIPWELVHVTKPGGSVTKKTMFLGELGLVRWHLDPRVPAAPDRLCVHKNRAHYLIPTYGGEPGLPELPEAQEEAQFLVQAFGARRVNPNLADTFDLLETRTGFDLFHFAGHGRQKEDVLAGEILFPTGVTAHGQFIPESLSAIDVAAHYSGSTRNERPLVVLNACHIGSQVYQLTGIGGFAQSFLRHRVGMFVGSLWSVLDQPARAFTESLYSSLVFGDTLSHASRVARRAARTAGDATWIAYVVYGHPYAVLNAE